MRYSERCWFAKKYPRSLRICETWIETWTVLHSLSRTKHRSRPRPRPRPLCLAPRAVAQWGWGMKRCQCSRKRGVQIVRTLKPHKYVMKGFACDRVVELT